MVEKPMARTPSEAHGMVEACKQSRVLLMVGFSRRFLPPLWTATQMIGGGDLGLVFHVECIWTSWSCSGSAGWRDSAQCLGGVLQDQGSHTLDLCQQWLGNATTVFAQARCIGPHLGCPRAVEDHLTAVLTHEGGATSVHVLSRDSHRPVSEFYRIYGTKGTLELEYTGDWSATAPDNWEMRLYGQGDPVPQRLVSRRPRNELLSELPDGHYAYYAELKRFAEAVAANNPTVSPSGEEALTTVRTVGAAFLSAAQGKSVDICEGDGFGEPVYQELLRAWSAT
jgi:predicted dehydrogenase